MRPDNPNSGQCFRAINSGELKGHRDPTCSGLGSSSLHTSEMTYRSADQFQLKRQGRRHGEDGLVASFFFSVRVTSVDVSTVSTHPWACSVDSATDEGFLFLFLFLFNLTYSRWTSSLPSCLWSQTIFPSLPGSRLTIFYRDACSALLQLVNQWLNFTYSRSHAFRYERTNTNPTLVRIELTTSAVAGVQVTY